MLAEFERFSRLRGNIPKSSNQASRRGGKGDACESREGNDEVGGVHFGICKEQSAK